MLDYVPGRSAPPLPPPDTSVPRAVFPWLVERLAARRRGDLPLTDASLRADVSLGFAAQLGDALVWPEAQYEGGVRLGLLVRPPEPAPPIAVECQYPRRAAPGQVTPAARQFGDLLRDALRLHRAFGSGGLPVQVLLCTDEFRTYLAALRPPLRLLRADSAGTEQRAELRLESLEEATRNRLASELAGVASVGAGAATNHTPPPANPADQPPTTLRVTFDVLGYAPVGPLHLAMWRVVEARAV